MKASTFIAQYLEKQGVTTVFEMSGGMITHILDSIYLEKKIRILSNHHEQAAAFAADGYARMSGVPGVALATSGPGATNLITGIGCCYFDSTPAVFITGQVNRNEQKGNLPIRQMGFQETDIAAIVKPITKAAFRIQEAEEIPRIFEEAFRTALSNRPGPVVIDIPMDLQRVDLAEDLIKPFLQKKNLAEPYTAEKSEIGIFYKKLFEALGKSKKASHIDRRRSAVGKSGEVVFGIRGSPRHSSDPFFDGGGCSAKRSSSSCRHDRNIRKPLGKSVDR